MNQPSPEPHESATSAVPVVDASPSLAMATPQVVVAVLLLLAWIAVDAVVIHRILPALAPDALWVGALVVLLLPMRHIWRIVVTQVLIDGERIVRRRGWPGRHEESLEIFRIQDVNWDQSWWEGLLGIGTITLLGSDQYHAVWRLNGVANGGALRLELTRRAVAVRQAKGMRELTVGR